MSKISGGCLCGAVRYRSDAEPKGAGVCHCTHCQKTSGSAFSVNVFVPSDGFTLTGPVASYTDTAESGRRLQRKFCSTCGSSLLSEAQAFPGMVILKAGTLDDRSWVKPAAHVWTSSRQSWCDIPAGVTAFEKGRT
jgi:hypothetical protein